MSNVKCQNNHLLSKCDAARTSSPYPIPLILQLSKSSPLNLQTSSFPLSLTPHPSLTQNTHLRRSRCWQGLAAGLSIPGRRQRSLQPYRARHGRLPARKTLQRRDP